MPCVFVLGSCNTIGNLSSTYSTDLPTTSAESANSSLAYSTDFAASQTNSTLQPNSTSQLRPFTSSLVSASTTGVVSMITTTVGFTSTAAVTATPPTEHTPSQSPFIAPTPSSRSAIGIIIGGIVGGFAALTVILVLLLCWRRRRGAVEDGITNRRAVRETIQPFEPNSEPYADNQETSQLTPSRSSLHWSVIAISSDTLLETRPDVTRGTADSSPGRGEPERDDLQHKKQSREVERQTHDLHQREIPSFAALDASTSSVPVLPSSGVVMLGTEEVEGQGINELRRRVEDLQMVVQRLMESDVAAVHDEPPPAYINDN